MARVAFETLLKKQMTRKEFLAFVGLVTATAFGVVGIIKELQSHAATLTASTEPEGGTRTGGVLVVNDTSASGAEAIQFEPTDVSTASVHIILLLGQSNMVGKAKDYDTTTLDPGDPRILQYTAAGVLKSGLDPLGHPDPNTLGGPGMAFAREYLLTLPPTHQIVLIPASYGGTGFSIPDSNGANMSWDISKPNTANNLYERSLTQLSNAIKAINKPVVIDGALLNMGGTDALNHMSGPTFQPYYDALINGYRTRLSLPNLPFVLGPSRPDAIAGNSWYAGINTVQIATPGRVAHTAYIPGAVGTDFYNTTDTVHFNQSGNRAMGRQYSHALSDLMNGVPTLTAPSGLRLFAAATSTELNAAWNTVTGATGYKVEYKKSSASGWTTYGTTAALNAPLTGLTSSTSYNIRITAVDGSNNLGPASSVFTAASTA